MEVLTLIQLAAGFALLFAGAEWLVRGASGLAVSVGISPLVVGLTVVAFGTSAPELAVSLRSVLGGQPDIALGAVIGSNTFNVLFILGVAALITPLVVAQALVRLDVPLMIGASFLLYGLALDGRIGRLEGLLLFGCLIAYTAFSVIKSRQESAEVRAEYEREHGPDPTSAGSKGKTLARNVALLVVGLVLISVGARWLVDGAVEVARYLGLSELVIGLTIVAGGTSLPEVATSVVASVRGERDIAVGNVVGSNLFNILGVLGLTSLLAPEGVSVAAAALRFDFPVMLAVAVACLPIFFTGHLIARWEGALFLGYYLAYVCYLILRATEDDALGAFSAVMLAFVLPLTCITLMVTAWRARGQGHPET